MYDTSQSWRNQRFDRWYHLVMVGLMLNAVFDNMPHGDALSLMVVTYATYQAQRGIAALWFCESDEHEIISTARLRYGLLGFVVGLHYLFHQLGQF